VLRISHETIYRYVWEDRRRRGLVYRYLRGAQKKKWKRYRSYDSRGRLAGKRPISSDWQAQRTALASAYLEGDTVLGSADRHCVLSLVDRKSGYLLLGKLRRPNHTGHHSTSQLSQFKGAPRPTRTLILDNGTEFHGYKDLERATGASVYFATPHHSWERGTCENTNGLIRQYLPKRQSMARVTQAHCDRIAATLNHRPRKRLGFLTPAEIYENQPDKPL
jgi:IS30 family transposase